ncbi:uncharacterized protein LOC132953587 [Metopolophium dirhodum]|uniref:uncharacterized protein LOC132953587 n=1 Tax=Metopolophium dirhodum TaxID=44670 RepID=UPI00298F7881|nr:uncharacterized protein LOC132953587 [Metopolophium dirhodum]
MSGSYSGLQARVKEINNLIYFVPCAAHSLNLVGTHAVDSSKEAVKYFGLMQHLFTFFTISTHRWEILSNNLKPGTHTLKHPSFTRWSSRDAACLSINENWSEIINALTYIMNATTENNMTRNESQGLLNKLQSLETCFMSILWGFLLNRLNVVSEKLQKVEIDCGLVVELYDSLIQLITNTHHLLNELNKRRAAYQNFFFPFAFIVMLERLSHDDIVKGATQLNEIYYDDMDLNELINECLHLKAHIIQLADDKQNNVPKLLQILHEKNLISIYPNIEIALRIYTSTAVTNCSAERSFSCLKRIKNYLRSTMSQDRLNALAILSIEHELTNQLSYDDIIEDFAKKKSRHEATISIQSFEDDVFDALCPSPITSCVRCAVHTLQLCILDGFKNAPITSCIVQARKVVKKLRTPKYATWLKRKNLKYAIIDNETRWNSVVNMLFRLLELKEFCQTHHSTNTELKLKKSEWDSIQSIVDALMPVKIATLALQKQDINLGDFFGVWLKASHGLQSNGSILAKQILKSMKQREVLLLKNPIFLAAIFLDPRYQCMLNETDKNTGINHLIKTWKCMIQIQDVCQTDDVNNSAIANVIDSPDNTAETIDDGFELFLSSQTSVASNRSETNILNDISTSLHNFKNVERLHYKTNILAFWESQKHDKSDLYKLANIVLAVPATQVSVERSFSGIKFILSDLRTSLSANLLDAIMILRSNTKFMKVNA